MNIGDQIKSKGITSPIAYGKAVCIMTALYYKTFIQPLCDFSLWNKKFPNWENKNVIVMLKSLRTDPLFDMSEAQGDVRYIKIAEKMLAYCEDELELSDPVEEINKAIN